MFRTISLTTLTAIALTAPAFAQDTAPSGWTTAGTATFTTDYVFRGFSQTDERPAVQGSISYTWNKLTISAKYQDTDVSENRCSGLCGERVVAALTYSFP